nr:laccase-12-like isoform X1 [Tanacetum cinerariifolium]
MALGQEGTLWWHAHSSWVRATVYGAIVIRPKEGTSYPFAKPNRDSVIILGEWWNVNPLAVIKEAMRTGGAPNVSDAYTINGQPGDLYNCSTNETVIVPIDSGETNLIRVINAALNQQLFFGIANHKLTVVGADASYVKPFTTNVLMLGAGETTDVLIKADQPPAQYYIAAQAYVSGLGAPLDNTITTAILEYKTAPYPAKGSSSKPVMPTLPAFDDTSTATAFTTSFRSPNKVSVPTDIDENLFITVALGLNPCPPNAPSNPPLRNTANVPVNGWVVIRFVADNPGAWFMHCHFDVHISLGFAMVFLVENGVGELETLSTLHFLKVLENSFEVLKVLKNSLEVLKVLKNSLEVLKVLQMEL